MKTITQVEHPSENVKLSLECDVVDGEKLDTSVSMMGQFAISWKCKDAFCKKLGDLIDEYRI